LTRARHPLEQIVADRQCMGCGFCTLIKASASGDNAPTVTMAYDEKLDHAVPRISGWTPGEDAGAFVCPGAEMDMPTQARNAYGHEPEDPMLGEIVSLRAAYAADTETRDASASGGVVPAVLARLFQTGVIDAAYTLRDTDKVAETRGALVHTAAQLKTIHGSVYHPANFGSGLQDLVGGTERFAFVGLPCEIAALQSLKSLYPAIAKRHVLSIGLFCGGINSHRGIDYYLSRFGVRWSDVDAVDYRSGPWPGGIKLATRDGSERRIPRIAHNTRWKILRYVIAFQGYWMLPRCRICPDQISDFADIAVGDPHLPRFRARNGDGFSVVISRTPHGEAVLKDVIAAGQLIEEPITRDEVIRSQGTTLDNRRHAEAYVAVARLLGLTPPRITVYAALRGRAAWRHYRYAFVDLMKLVLPQNRFLRALYLPWQIFEYVFITFAPNLIGRRIANLLRNRAG